MASLNGLSCCGVREIDGLRLFGVRKSMKDIAPDILHGCAFVIFTGVVSENVSENAQYGQRFAKYIIKNRLGEVTASPRRLNPNSQNMLAVWIWTVDHEALARWVVRNCPYASTMCATAC